MTLSTRIAAIAKRMAKKIPGPYKPPAKAAASWRTLRLGQYLQLKTNTANANTNTEFYFGGERWDPSTRFKVTSVDSQGVNLKVATTSGKSNSIRWTKPDWQDYFERLRKTKALEEKFNE